MIHFFDFVSNWFLEISLFGEYFNFSVYPGLIFSLLGTIYLSLKYRISFELFIFQLALHSIPILWTKRSIEGILYNILIGLIYIMYIRLQGEDICDIYDRQYKHLKKIKYIGEFVKNTNISHICLIVSINLLIKYILNV